MSFEVVKTIEYWHKKDFYNRCTEDFSRQKFTEMEDVYRWLIQKLEM